MEIEKEDKKRILDAASELMKAYSDFRCEVERMKTVHELAKNVAGIEMSAESVRASLVPLEEKLSEKHKAFCETIGVSEADKDFWEWYDKQPPSMDELKERIDNM